MIITGMRQQGGMLYSPPPPPPSPTAGSVLFNGTSQYLNTPSTSAFAFGTNDFTIETWIYPNSLSGRLWFFSSDRDNVDLNGNGGIYYFGEGGVRNSATNTVITVGTWHHIALVRASGTLTLYVNGSSVMSQSGIGYNSAANRSIDIGYSAAQGNGYFNGRMSNFRVVKGTALYIGSTITVPTAPLSAISGTQLLLNTTNDANFLKDSSTNNITITNNGSVSSSTSNPFTLQGSLSFNGSNQYLSLDPGLIMSSGAFTIEAWLYNNSDFTSRGWLGTDIDFGMHLFTTDDYNITIDRSGGNGAISYSWSPGTFQLNTWQYFILNRNASGLETMWVGTLGSPGAAVTCYRATSAAGNFDPTSFAAGTCVDSYDWYGASNFIGRYYGGYFPGYITNFRATIGDAKYDSNNSTVLAPSIELTSDAYTRYLMTGAAVTTDSSGTQTVTNNNGVTQIATKPF